MSTPHADRRIGEIVSPGGSSLQGPHRVEAFAACPQLEAFGHELRLRSVFPKEPTAVGTIIHAGLAYLYGAMLPVKPEWLVYESPVHMMALEAEKIGAPPEFLNHSLKAYDRYVVDYAAEISQRLLIPVLVEHQFVIHNENGEPYSCRADMVAWLWDAAAQRWDLCIIDHKCVGRIGNEGGKYHVDMQMATNLWLARARGYPVTRVVINAIHRKPPYECMRFDVPVNQFAYNRLSADVRYYLDKMKAVRVSHPNPMDRPRNRNACTTKYGPCEYFGLCWRGEGLEQFISTAELNKGNR